VVRVKVSRLMATVERQVAPMCGVKQFSGVSPMVTVKKWKAFWAVVCA
jgi:hypothetical protein